MEHFDLTEWVDFARQVVPPGRAAAMQEHLSAGCETCSKALQLWQRVSEITRGEACYRPPESVVRFVKDFYALHKPETVQPCSAWLAPRLVLDSFRQPALAGVRGVGTSPRQLLYKAGRFLVDMRIEPHAGSGRLSLVGQVLDSNQPENGLEEVPVVLLRGEEKRACTTTTRFGEFHLEFESSEGLRLWVGIGPGKEIIVPLGGLQARREMRASSKSESVE